MKQFFQIVIFAILLVGFSTDALCQSKRNGKKKKTPAVSIDSNSTSSNGKGYTVAGAIVTPVAASVGGTLLILGLLNGLSCYSGYQSEGTKERCEKSKIETYGGLAILTFGMGSGIYMTVKGKRMRRQFEEKSAAEPEVSFNWALNF